MIKRIALLDMTTAADGSRAPAVQPEATGWVMLHDFGQRALVKMALPDGTPTGTGWLADITMQQAEDGTWQQTDITATALTAAQLTAIKTFLTNRGFDVSSLDATVTNRKQLLSKVLRFVAHRTDLDDFATLANGYDAG